MKELIKKYLQEQVIDMVGETRPYIDPDFIDVYADDIEKLVKNNAVLPHVSVAKYPLPRPLEAWKAAREMDCGDYCYWHLEQERRGNAR